MHTHTQDELKCLHACIDVKSRIICNFMRRGNLRPSTSACRRTHVLWTYYTQKVSRWIDPQLCRIRCMQPVRAFVALRARTFCVHGKCTFVGWRFVFVYLSSFICGSAYTACIDLADFQNQESTSHLSLQALWSSLDKALQMEATWNVCLGSNIACSEPVSLRFSTVIPHLFLLSRPDYFLLPCHWLACGRFRWCRWSRSCHFLCRSSCQKSQRCAPLE